MRFQTRMGLETPNNTPIRRNVNINNLDRRNMDNLSGIGPNTTNNIVRRNTIVGPNTATDFTRRNLANEPNNMTKRANTIAQRVANLKEVDNCSVLINGNSCIVGVDIKDTLEGRMTTDLKRRIEKTVKNTDSSIKNIGVTADPDLLTRITNMATDMGNGKPISGFAREFQEILRRIIPAK